MLKINKKKLFCKERILAFTGLAFLVIISAARPLSAQSIAQGYATDQTLQRGMLVASKQDDPNKVEAVTVDSLDRLKGVVVQPNDSSVTISSEGQKVFVAATGTYEVLVSDQSGQIKTGDYISISSLAGIGMKASDTQSFIIGKAAQNFDGKTDSVGSSVIADDQRVNFARIRVDVAINRNPLLKSPDAPKIPGILNKISQAVAEKPVSSAKVYLATAVFLVSATISGIMLYSGARGSLISIGRNPLSKKVVIRGLIQVVLMSLIIFITGLFGVYLLLKL